MIDGIPLRYIYVALHNVLYFTGEWAPRVSMMSFVRVSLVSCYSVIRVHMYIWCIFFMLVVSLTPLAAALFGLTSPTFHAYHNNACLHYEWKWTPNINLPCSPKTTSSMFGAVDIYLSYSKWPMGCNINPIKHLSLVYKCRDVSDKPVGHLDYCRLLRKMYTKLLIAKTLTHWWPRLDHPLNFWPRPDGLVIGILAGIEIPGSYTTTSYNGSTKYIHFTSNVALHYICIHDYANKYVLHDVVRDRHYGLKSRFHGNPKGRACGVIGLNQVTTFSTEVYQIWTKISLNVNRSYLISDLWLDLDLVSFSFCFVYDASTHLPTLIPNKTIICNQMHLHDYVSLRNLLNVGHAVMISLILAQFKNMEQIMGFWPLAWKRLAGLAAMLARWKISFNANLCVLLLNLFINVQWRVQLLALFNKGHFSKMHNN